MTIPIAIWSTGALRVKGLKRNKYSVLAFLMTQKSVEPLGIRKESWFPNLFPNSSKIPSLVTAFSLPVVIVGSGI